MSEPQKGNPQATRRILIADDDPERLAAVRDRFQGEGFAVISAQDGLEALDRAREDLPDAIVLNLLLRRIDGLRVCEILKSNPATTNIPVLLMAAVHVDADEGRRALAAGADRFVGDLGPISTGSGRELGDGQDLVQAVRGLLGAEPELEHVRALDHRRDHVPVSPPAHLREQRLLRLANDLRLFGQKVAESRNATQLK